MCSFRGSFANRGNGTELYSSDVGYNANFDTKCTPGVKAGVHFALPGVHFTLPGVHFTLPGVHFSEVGCICVGWDASRQTGIILSQIK